MKYADRISAEIKKMIDDFIEENNISAPAAHYDETDTPDHEAVCASEISSLYLKERNITSIIWSTGFTADFSYIKLPVFDENGKLKHKNGIPEFPGLFFIGYPWLKSKKSTILFGILEDVEYIVDAICRT